MFDSTVNNALNKLTNRPSVFDQNKSEYSMRILEGLQLENQGKFSEAEKVFYRAWRLAVWSMFESISSDLATSAQEHRQRMYRKMKGA